MKSLTLFKDRERFRLRYRGTNGERGERCKEIDR